MPACKKCGLTDPAEFYEYQPSECKPCTRARVVANRQAKLDYYRGFDRDRAKNPERKRQYLDKTIRLRGKVPRMNSAHCKVARAVRNGDLIRPATCERCPATDRIQAHHDDHTKPLDVMWLCPVCHAARHREIGRLRRVHEVYTMTD